MSSDDNIFKRESPWGSPPGGGNDNGNGSGSGQRRQPPNIDDIIRKAQGSVGRIFPGGRMSGNKPIYIGLVVLLVLWALSGLYRVLPDEQGVVLRFGQFTKTTQPGLNYHIPFPI